MNYEDRPENIGISDYEFFRRKAVRQLKNKCVVCGCGDYTLLEIDHKNGVQNRRQDSGVSFFKSIIRGERNDLQLLCITCHDLKHLYPGIKLAEIRRIIEGNRYNQEEKLMRKKYWR